MNNKNNESATSVYGNKNNNNRNRSYTFISNNHNHNNSNNDNNSNLRDIMKMMGIRKQRNAKWHVWKKKTKMFMNHYPNNR